jgi:hypothetical protein
MLKSRAGLIALMSLVGATAAYGVVQRGILNPQMTPEMGTYDRPMGTLGEKPSMPWSATTIEAGVNKKPLPGRIVTRVGEIVDYSCYLQLGKHGGAHKDCGQKCLRNGMPIGLLTKEGGLYLLMEEEHHPRRDGKTNFREAAIEHLSHVMEVTGTFSEVDRQKAIYVTGFTNKQP